jgi:hypothetical protein
MKKHSTIILILVFSIFSLIAEAQIGNRLKRAVERGVSEAVEKKTEEAARDIAEKQLDKALESLYGDEENQSEEKRASNLSRMMNSLNMDAETKDAYYFSGYAEMEISGTEANGKAREPAQIKTYFNENENYSGMEFSENAKSKEKSTMIFDFDNDVSIVLMDNKGERYSIAMVMDWEQLSETAIDAAQNESELADYKDFSFERTGKTKTIHGYVCDEIAYEGPEERGSYWVSRGSNKGMNSLWGSNNPFMTERFKNMNPDYMAMMPEGDVLEIYQKSKVDKTEVHLKMIDINENNSIIFSMDDYPGMMQASK